MRREFAMKEGRGGLRPQETFLPRDQAKRLLRRRYIILSVLARGQAGIAVTGRRRIR